MQKPAAAPLALEVPAVLPTETAAPTATPAPMVVFVSGAVQNPGVYTLPAESRVVDALAAAGGPTEDAAAESLNQATRLSDGMQVHLPEQGSAPLPMPLSPASASGSAGAPASGTLVYLNSADATTLETLPGVGPALAARIIEYRSANGPFTSVEQLSEVKGIGDRLLEKIREQVVLN
ncbi:MAG: helix-hairpin-helix domain-containing protein [Ardenticatenales bacterium]|nr:helix-hairpin-helix domain-containing protein [Ardenticatenales bacterium]